MFINVVVKISGKNETYRIQNLMHHSQKNNHVVVILILFASFLDGACMLSLYIDTCISLTLGGADWDVYA